MTDNIRLLSAKVIVKAIRYLCANYAVKTYDYFLKTVTGMVKGVYNGYIGGDFVNMLSDLVFDQLNQAYRTAWADEGGEGAIPDYLQEAVDDQIQTQWDFIDGLYKSIVDARIDGTPVEPFLVRAELWAQQYQNAYREAVRLIAIERGGKLEWVEGDTIKKCPVCVGLNGIVAYASEWDELGVRPGNGPNPALSAQPEACGGWRCGCQLIPTDKRRTPKAYDEIIRLTSGGA